MNATIERLVSALTTGEEEKVREVLAPDVKFLPPTYWATWSGREPVSALLGHVAQIFTDFSYRRIMGEGNDWALEFQCKVGPLDAVGVDLVTLDNDLVSTFEVVMRPHKTVGLLRDEMMSRIGRDPRFAEYRKALG